MGTTTNTTRPIYTVHLHDFHGGDTVYEGRSEVQAIRAARKHDCTRDGQCVAGPTIIRTDPDGTEYVAAFWHAAKPFCVADELQWIRR